MGFKVYNLLLRGMGLAELKANISLKKSIDWATYIQTAIKE